MTSYGLDGWFWAIFDPAPIWPIVLTFCVDLGQQWPDMTSYMLGEWFVAIFELTGPFAGELGHIITSYYFLEARKIILSKCTLFLWLFQVIMEKGLLYSNPDDKKSYLVLMVAVFFVFPISHPVHPTDPYICMPPNKHEISRPVAYLLAQVCIVSFDRAYKEVPTTKYWTCSMAHFFVIWLYLQKAMFRPRDCDPDLWPMNVNISWYIDYDYIRVLYEFQIKYRNIEI